MKLILLLAPAILTLNPSAIVAAEKIETPPPPVSRAATNLPPKVLSFAADKEDQVKRLAVKLKAEVPQIAVDFFDAAKKGDWPQSFDLYRELKDLLRNDSRMENQQALEVTLGAAALEVQLAFEQFVEGEPKYALACGEAIVKSIPRGSIYFGGTDPGRGLPTALCASHEKADPFFTLTQNALAGSHYLTYLGTMYGGRISVPTKDDSDKAFKEYIDDAKRRLEHDRGFPSEPKQIKPGENVVMRDNRVQVSGHVAVMAINALLAKSVFDRNPEHEFFIEESSPLDWAYPHLSPHGLVMKINRKPLPGLSAAEVEKDRKFWIEQQRPLIGCWLKPETSVKEVCAFADKVFVDQVMEGFQGDERFVRSDYAAKMYSKLRSSIGGVYAWRAKQTREPAERERMRREADFAFRQAFALCPSSMEAVFRYADLLTEQKRFDDALLIAETARKLRPEDGVLESLIQDLERLKKP